MKNIGPLALETVGFASGESIEDSGPLESLALETVRFVRAKVSRMRALLRTALALETVGWKSGESFRDGNFANIGDGAALAQDAPLAFRR